MYADFHNKNVLGLISLTSISTMVYIISIFKLQEWRDKNSIVFPVFVRRWVSWWFWLMAMYSITTTLAMTPVMRWLHETGTHCGLLHLPFYMNEWAYGWSLTFYFSKIIELGDTFCFLLINRNLILLQWFHHVATLWYVLYCMYFFPMTGFFFAYINLLVHSFMYMYFSYSVHPERNVPFPAVIITIGQILQMVFGVSLITAMTIHCPSYGTDYVGLTMYIIYFGLFCELFVKKYFLRS